MRYVLDRTSVSTFIQIGVISGIRLGYHGSKAGLALHGSKEPLFILIRNIHDGDVQAYSVNGDIILAQEIEERFSGLVGPFLNDSQP